jgi:hypothetical protein
MNGIVLMHLARGFRSLWLQVQDAYRKGGARMVLSKVARRLSAGLVKTLGLGGLG